MSLDFAFKATADFCVKLCQKTLTDLCVCYHRSACAPTPRRRAVSNIGVIVAANTAKRTAGHPWGSLEAKPPQIGAGRVATFVKVAGVDVCCSSRYAMTTIEADFSPTPTGKRATGHLYISTQEFGFWLREVALPRFPGKCIFLHLHIRHFLH